MREEVEFNKSCNLIGSGSGRNFLTGPLTAGEILALVSWACVMTLNFFDTESVYLQKYGNRIQIKIFPFETFSLEVALILHWLSNAVRVNN